VPYKAWKTSGLIFYLFATNKTTTIASIEIPEATKSMMARMELNRLIGFSKFMS
jgi:hypothetical protein